VSEPPAADWEARNRSTTVLGASSIMALGTVVSRITGFARNVVMAYALGTAILASTYTVANTVPNIIYILLIGGALNSIFVPQLVRAIKTDPDGGKAYTNRLLTLTASALLIITIVAVLAAPLLIRLYGKEFTGPGLEAELELTVAFARYCLPQIFFYGFFVMLGQVLNARGSFGPMMWTPILNNLVVIATFGLFLAVSDRGALDAAAITAGEARLLGVGTTLGVVVQAVALLPALTRSGFRWRPRFDWRGVGLGKAGELASWTILSVLVNQIGYLVIVRLATAIDVAAKNQGIDYGIGYTAYTNASLLFILPHSIITVSLVTALLPRMSSAATEGSLAELRDNLSSGLRLSAVAIVPAAFAFLALGREISGVIYANIPQAPQSAYVIGYLLMAFGLGLIPFSARFLAERGFYALQDSRTPFFIMICINVVNIALALLSYFLLPTRWVMVGVAASYGISYTVGLAISLRVLGRRIGGWDAPRVTSSYAKLIVASILPAAMAFGVARSVSAAGHGGLTGSLLGLGAGGVILASGYLLLARLLRVNELSSLIVTIRRSRG